MEERPVSRDLRLEAKDLYLEPLSEALKPYSIQGEAILKRE
jgi:hypothetical protein